MIRQSFHDLAPGLCLMLLTSRYVNGFLRLGRQAMTENSTAREAQSRPVAPKRRWGWLHIAGVIAIGLIALIAIALAIKGFVACQGRECVTGHVQHLLAFLSTLTAALASLRQGKTAKMRSDHHLDSWHTEADAKLKSAHAYDFHHFKMVGFWWYTFLLGAIAAAVAEFIDWWGQPFINWLLKFI